MIRNTFLLICGVAIFLFFTGCAGPSRLAMDYGTSVRLAKFNQILNPEAEKNLTPVTGFDGQAAEKIMERYHKGFERPTTAPGYIINIGGMSRGATAVGAQY
jgi:hypothetical protein